MWYKIKAKDMSLGKPNGIVVTFSIWADDEKKLSKILADKNCVDISILDSTEEEWTPEWADSVDENSVIEMIPDPKDIPNIESENPFW